MKIQYMSDLHLEFEDMQVPDVVGDVLVLAGDIHVGTNAIPFIKDCSKVFKHVIYILGNHEYYGQKMWKLPDKFNFTEENIHFLDNDTVEIDDVNFIGSTLWSKAHPDLKFMMNDFKRITNKHKDYYGSFSPQDAVQLFYKNKQFLKDSIKHGMKNVIITHHAPSNKMVDYSHNDPWLNSGYATDIVHEFENVSLWISGHTHAAKNVVVNDIHCVSNCKGYYNEVKDFNPLGVVEI